MSTHTEAAQKLDAVADTLERGWCQFRDSAVIDGKQCFCLDGALIAIAGRTEAYGEAFRAITQTLGTYTIIAWNDHPARTQAEVVAVVRKAAELVRRSA